MEIDITNCKVYIISPGTGSYTDRLMTAIRRLVDLGFQSIEYVRSVVDENKANSLTLTVISILERELYTTNPFLILEDDIQIYNIQRHFHIPSNTKAVYLGLSWWIYPFHYDSLLYPDRDNIFQIQPVSPVHVSSVDDTFATIRGILATHAILFIDRDFMNEFLERVNAILPLKVPHDLLFATMQHEHKVLALKAPLFYQDSQLGGQEDVTKLWWDSKECTYNKN